MKLTRRFFAGLVAAVSILAFATLEATAHPEDVSKTIALVQAIDQIDPQNEMAWTKSGKPKVSALEQIMGGKVSAAERDAAWAAHDSLSGVIVDNTNIMAERDTAVSEAVIAKRQAEVATDRAARAERAAREADKVASQARASEGVALVRAAAAESKLREMSSGKPTCAGPRAVLQDNLDAFWQSDLRKAAVGLLDCIALGE